MLPDALVANMLNLAKLIHDDYNRHLREEGKAIKYPTWDSLPDDLKFSNIRQAQNIPLKLDDIGCYIGDGIGAEVVESFTEDEITTMSMKEHELWVDEREMNGWVYGPVKDVSRKISDCIVPWEFLSEGMKEYDKNVSRNIIPLVEGIGLKVCRKLVTDRVIETTDYYRGDKAPLIVAITGHVDVPVSEYSRIEERIGTMLDSYRARYSNTPLILMSALAEGPDRIAAKVAFSRGIHVAPVLPMPPNEYEGTFAGFGYHSTQESIDDFNGILGNGLCYSPCILCGSSANVHRMYRVLAAYLVTNSHVLIAAWDGRTYGVKGGTYDCVRMSVNGVDPDLADMVNPMTSVSASPVISPVRYLDTSVDSPVFWIEVGRSLDKEGFKERLCDNMERIPGQYSGYISKRDPLSDSDDVTKRGVLAFLRGLIPEREDVAPPHDSGMSAPDDVTIERNDVRDLLSPLLPGRHDATFLRMDDLNADLESLEQRGTSYGEDGCGLLTGSFESTTAVKEAGVMSDMAIRFSRLSDLSSYYDKRSKRSIRALTAISAISSLFFYCMILFSGTLIFTLFYAVVFILLLCLTRKHFDDREHKKFIEYSTLAESLRTEFYWGMLGINDEVSRNCRGYQKSGMAWASAILKGYDSYFSNNYSLSNRVSLKNRIECAEDSWIEERRAAYNIEAKDAGIKYGILSCLSFRGRQMIAILSVAAVVVGLFFMEHFDDSLFHLVDLDVGSLSVSEGTGITGYDLIKLMMIFVTVFVNILLSLMNTVYKDTDTQVISKRLTFDQALTSLRARMNTSEHRVIEQKTALFHELGVQLTNDSNDWVFQYLNRDFNAPGKLLNLGRKTESSEIAVDELDDL